MSVNELFSGVGSQKAALDNIGVNHKIIGVSEIDKDALKSYELLHGKARNYGDITELEKLDYADIWTYSFPCQSISLAGSKAGLTRGSNTQSSLLWEIERLLGVSEGLGELPKYLVLENVKNLVGERFKKDFDNWLEILSNLGYNTYFEVLNSKDYGVAQSRERVIAVSVRKDIDTESVFRFNNKGSLNKCLGDFLEFGFDGATEYFPSSIIRKESKTPRILYYDVPKMVRVRKYGVDVVSLVKELRRGKKDKKLSNMQIAEQLGQPVTLVEHWFRADKYNSIPLDSIWFDLKDLLGITTTEFDESVMTFEEREGKYDQSNRVYDIRGVAPTITTISGSIRVTDGVKVRVLTVREVWRLMGFTDVQIDKLLGEVSEVQLYKQAGNSIVVGVLEEVFREIARKEGVI